MKFPTLLASVAAGFAVGVSASPPSADDFFVPGDAIPDVPFNVGPSYAGTLPITTAASNESIVADLFFWYWPKTTSNHGYSSPPSTPDSLVIFFGGGPGCSSLTALTQQFGPFMFPPPCSSSSSSLPHAVPNPNAWTALSDVLYIDQPLGTGLSASGAPPTATSLLSVADQFLSFWASFSAVFPVTDKRVFLAGESYAGRYMPAIANRAAELGAATSLDVSGILAISPLLTDPPRVDATTGALVPPPLQNLIPLVGFVESFQNELPLGEDAYSQLNDLQTACGYPAYLDEYLIFPAAGPQPPASQLPGTGEDGSTTLECGLGIVSIIQEAGTAVNPCFDPYLITSRCPPNSDSVVQAYFNRADVQALLHVPPAADNTPRSFFTCTDTAVFVGGVDASPAVILGALGEVVDRTGNVIVASGGRDGMFPWNGTLLALQNMTWGGGMGFQQAPVGCSGGCEHEERGLEFTLVPQAGHFIGRDAPRAAFNLVQKILGY